MKITLVETTPLQIPLRRPFKTAKAEQQNASVVIIKLHTDAGIIGIGESDPRPHITGETVDSVLAAVSGYLTPAVRGMELSAVDDIGKICAQMDRVLVSNPSAKAGIDIAAYDALGKWKGVPVHSLLGQKQRETLQSCGFSDLGTREEAEEDAEKCKRLGCKNFKIKVGRNWVTDLERLDAVRLILGTEVDVIADPNQAWSVEQSIEVLKEAKSHLTVCEQPTPWDDLLGLATIAKDVDVPIIADEAVRSPSDAAILLRLKAADMVNVKHLKSGGLRRASEIAEILQNAGVECMIGSTMETSVSSAASMHLGLACPNLKYFDVAPPTDFLIEDIADGLQWNGLEVKPNDRPGLGLELREGILAKYAIRRPHSL
jgi:L-alanine-DL-glutamate epimerase-like enolase superfamily enzyme